MNRREFTAVLRSITDRKRQLVDQEKARALPEDVRDQLVRFIVRNRGPVLTVLLGPQTDRSWLASMGYLYPFSRSGFEFVGTCERVI